jgi:hypothetical protein
MDLISLPESVEDAVLQQVSVEIEEANTATQEEEVIV